MVAISWGITQSLASNVALVGFPQRLPRLNAGATDDLTKVERAQRAGDEAPHVNEADGQE